MQSGPKFAGSLTLGLVLVGASFTGLAREETAVFQDEKPLPATAEYASRAVADAQSLFGVAGAMMPTPEPSDDGASTASLASASGLDFDYETLPPPQLDGEPARPGPALEQITAAPEAELLQAAKAKTVAPPTVEPPELPSRLEEAQRLARTGDLSGALASLEPAVTEEESAEERLDVFYMKGMLLLAEGDNEGAKEVFSTLVTDYPSLPEPYNNLAAIYASEGDLEKARSLLEDLLKENPDYVVALENLGDVYTKLAADSYRRARALEPGQDTVAMKLKLLDRLFEPTI